MYDTIIIGAGPAGIAASIYAARKKLNTLLISANIGGQVNTTWGIENYIGYHFIEG
ncbi:MAG: FAD-dependent oxidoreductase, partial [Peptococcaceae bacterium]